MYKKLKNVNKEYDSNALNCILEASESHEILKTNFLVQFFKLLKNWMLKRSKISFIDKSIFLDKT